MLSKSGRTADVRSPERYKASRLKHGTVKRPRAWIRRQFQFSLATLLQWILAYAVSYVFARLRADYFIGTRALAGALAVMLVYRCLFQVDGRRVLHYLFFAILITGGYFCGAIVLRDVRRELVAKLVEEDSKTLARLKTEDATIEMQERKLMVEPPSLAQDQIRLRIKEFLKSKAVIASRMNQLNGVIGDLGVSLVPIPARTEDWSPLLVPVENRIDLPVSCELIDATQQDFESVVWALLGLRCETDALTTSWLRSKSRGISLCVTDMPASSWLAWICKLWEIEFSIDRRAGKIFLP